MVLVCLGLKLLHGSGALFVLPHHFRRPEGEVMSQMPIGPSVEAPAPCSPGLAEAGGEYGCGTTVDGQWERGKQVWEV